MRPLSARSYELLLRLQCPMLVTPAESLPQRLYAAALWRVIHEEPWKWCKSASDEAIHATAEVLMQGPIEALFIFRHMTAEITKMERAIVETESESGLPLTSTTVMSPTTSLP